MNKWFSSIIVSKIREAIDKYDMIKPGDRILVGVSGGKDSSILFYVLNMLKKYGIYDFDVAGITVDHGLIDNIEAYETFCLKNQMTLIIHHEHYAVKLSEESEYAPCYTCSRLRKGIIKRYALERGFNKIALGHTKDDLVETFLMNIIAHGKLGSISPVSTIEEDIHMIRPLVFLDEIAILKAVKYLEIPLMSDVCTFSHGRLRSQSESLIEQIELTVPDFSDKVIQALSRIN